MACADMQLSQSDSEHIVNLSVEVKAEVKLKLKPFGKCLEACTFVILLAMNVAQIDVCVGSPTKG